MRCLKWTSMAWSLFNNACINMLWHSYPEWWHSADTKLIYSSSFWISICTIRQQCTTWIIVVNVNLLIIKHHKKKTRCLSCRPSWKLGSYKFHLETATDLWKMMNGLWRMKISDNNKVQGWWRTTDKTRLEKLTRTYM